MPGRYQFRTEKTERRLERQYDMLKMILINALSLSFRILSIILNSIGVFYLQGLQSNMTHQKVLLTSYSITGILMSITAIVSLSPCISYAAAECSSSQTMNCTNSHVTVATIHFYTVFVYLLTLLILLADRIIGVTFPLKYTVIFPKSRLLLTTAITWILSLLLAIPIAVRYSDVGFKYALISSFVLDLIVLISTIVGYVWIGYKVHQSRNTAGQSRSSTEFKILKVATCIVFAFLFLFVIPDCIIAITFGIMGKIDSFSKIGPMVLLLNSIHDVVSPIIYLYGLPPLRNAIKHRFHQICRWFHNKARNSIG